MSGLNLGRLVEMLQFQRAQHIKAMEDLQREIKNAEDALDNLYAHLEQRRGAAGAKDETLTALQELANDFDGTPATDPLADSDQ